ncbi:hypothetical protein QJQ45_007137 [Haematococcus lacustris]|nr:hypothetical protein QJQ45_007137 [Haematococcus lacustris]
MTQLLRLQNFGAQDRALQQFFKKLEDMAEVSMERHGSAKQLVVFFGAARIGTRGGAIRRADWKPPAGQMEHRLVRPAWSQQRDQPVRGLMWCPVVAPRKPPQAPRSSQEATPAAASEQGPSTPPPAKRSKRNKAEQAAEPTQPTKGKTKGKAAKAKPGPQPGRWLDRDCNAALNMHRVGESKWRPLELCWWPEQGKLPAKGKEYPGLGYKRLRNKPPKAQQQQPAAAQPRGTDQLRGRVVLVDEHRTSQVSSAVNGKQPCEVELDKVRATRPAGWKPPAGQVEPRLVRPAWSQERDQPVRGLAPTGPTQRPGSHTASSLRARAQHTPASQRSKRTKAEPGAAEPTKGKGKGKAAKAKPGPQPGRWLDRDCNSALNMQRIGESRWRPLELCYWPDQGALPAKGKEYPGLGYKRLQDKPPKAKEQQQQPAVAQ